MSETRCGFVALVGSPNAGKSTLLNALVGEKISIVTPKVQTTRHRILGITVVENSQLVLVDTPGIFTPKRRLERAMVHSAWTASEDTDLTCLLIDVSRKDLDPHITLLDQLNAQGISPILVLNKIDLIPPAKLLEIAAFVTQNRQVQETFMISALKSDGVTDLKLYLAQHVPIGPWHFPEDQLTDMPLRLLAAETTREKLFMILRDELPYSLMVETDTWENFQNGDVKITQTITVQREGQKKIVLGEGGALIKQVGQRARAALEKFLHRKVHLFLHVKVRSNWLEKPDYYESMGLEFDIKE